MDYAYEDGVKATVKQHVKNLHEVLGETINCTDEEFAERGYIIEEVGRFVDKLCEEYEEDERLDAEKFGNNIYQYEQKRGDYCHENGYYSEGIAFSAGTYGNIGRIDKIVDKDNKTIKYIYWA